MADRPIPFSAPMVRALLADTKTQTRRVVKWRGAAPGLNLGFTGLRAFKECHGWSLSSRGIGGQWEDRTESTPCPYGQPGEGRLWVRETFAFRPEWDVMPPSTVPVDADRWYAECHSRQKGLNPRIGKWRPGMFMPRWASRITLAVLSVRVERLQDISEADAIAEGVEDTKSMILGAGGAEITGPVAEYAVLWEQINGPGSWDANPWVWVVEFKRLANEERTVR